MTRCFRSYPKCTRIPGTHSRKRGAKSMKYMLYVAFAMALRNPLGKANCRDILWKRFQRVCRCVAKILNGSSLHVTSASFSEQRSWCKPPKLSMKLQYGAVVSNCSQSAPYSKYGISAHGHDCSNRNVSSMHGPLLPKKYGYGFHLEA